MSNATKLLALPWMQLSCMFWQLLLTVMGTVCLYRLQVCKSNKAISYNMNRLRIVGAVLDLFYTQLR